MPAVGWLPVLVMDSLPSRSPPSSVTVGVFDGVHLGHRRIIRRLLRVSSERGLVPTVVTFDTHPLATLRPDEAPKLLSGLADKADLLCSLGVERLVVLEFNHDFASRTHEEFTEEILSGCLNAAVVVAGAGFRFGCERRGSVETLRADGDRLGFHVETVGQLAMPGVSEPVSSSAIRRELASNGVALAAQMLGRPYAISGEVVMGDQRGRTIGFPTANIPVARNLAWPADGVYAGWFTNSDGVRYDCAINIGRRPTFYQNVEHSTLEAHLLDFDDDLYGHEVTVEFGEFLRSERRFSGIDALAAQLRVDVANAREILNRLR